MKNKMRLVMLMMLIEARFASICVGGFCKIDFAKSGNLDSGRSGFELFCRRCLPVKALSQRPEAGKFFPLFLRGGQICAILCCGGVKNRNVENPESGLCPIRSRVI